jgi:hypothetical protein
VFFVDEKTTINALEQLRDKAQVAEMRGLALDKVM